MENVPHLRDTGFIGLTHENVATAAHTDSYIINASCEVWPGSETRPGPRVTDNPEGELRCSSGLAQRGSGLTAHRQLHNNSQHGIDWMDNQGLNTRVRP